VLFRFKIRIVIGAITLIINSGYIHGQSPLIPTDSLSAYFQFDSTSGLGFLQTYFPSFFIQNGLELKSFIRSGTFKQLRLQVGDLKSIDAIFIRAMKLTNNNTAVALFLSTVACFDHRTIGLNVPVFALFFPLSNESGAEFKERVANLPRKLYADTPRGKIGDRDKLQHFFGSAFIAYAFESSEPAERASDFIENGEEAFIVDGTLDTRDIRANRQGQRFGLALLKNHCQLPSEYFVPRAALPVDSLSRSQTVSPDSSNTMRVH